MDDKQNDKSSLRKLSGCLQEASTLINTMLVPQRERRTELPETQPTRQTQTGEADATSTISSTLNRARLMIQESSSKGLYTRLKKKERLRATSSKSSDTNPKKPRLEVLKQKVFEFVLLHTEDCDEKDAMLFTESMVALRGFIETTTAASEVDIRKQLGQAIRLKFPLVTNNDFEFVRANRRRITKPVSCNEYNYQQIKLLAGQGCIYLKMKDGFDCLFVEEGLEDNEFDFEKDEKSIPKENPTTVPSAGTSSNTVVSSEVLQPFPHSQVIPPSLAGNSPSTPVISPPQPADMSPPIQPPNTKTAISSVADECITYCKEHNISNPVEILRVAQGSIVTGKPLNGYAGVPGETFNDKSSFILINRQDVLGTALEEVSSIEDPQLSLEVSFYGENAQDAGGPRREFFRLCLQDIKQKYFDNGLKEHLSEDYKTVGLIMALSILQNGNIPRFLTEDQLQEIFISDSPKSNCLTNLREGFNKLGLHEIGKTLPIFLHLFRQSEAAALIRKQLMHILTPKFSEDGCNARPFENQCYAAFSKYTREAASGRRGNVTLEHILQFVSGTDEEPALGFSTKPSVVFPTSPSSSVWSFIPTSNTCANVLHLPCPAHDISLPGEENLFEVYDMAFCNAYFGKH